MNDDLPDLVVDLILNDGRFKRALESIVKKIEDAEGGVDRSTRNMARSWDRLERKISGTIGRVEKRIVQFGVATATALATAFTGQAVSLASDFQRSVANISTLLDEGSVSIERYREQLLQLSTRSSKDVLDLSQALYQTISAGIPAVEGAGGAFQFLDAAQKAAVAGLSTTEEAVNALATVVNAFGQENISAARASDLLFESVKRGRTTFPELASALGRVAPVAASFNASTEEMLGLLVELTKAGLSTNEAVTAVRAVFLGLVRPAEKVKKELDKLGLSFSAQEIKTKGVVGVFRELTDAVGGDADALAQLFPNVRALLPAVVSVGDGFADFEKTVQGLTDSVGATDRALSKIKPTFSETAAIFKSQLQAVLINAGERVLPLIQKRLQALGDYLTENSDNIAAGFERFVEALDSIAEFIKENGATILKWLARVWAITKILAFTKAIKTASAALVSFGGIGVKLASIMTGAGVVGAALAGAALLGQYIGEKIVEKMEESFENSDVVQRLRDQTEELIRQEQEALAGRGAETAEQLQEGTRRIEAGEAIPLGGLDVGDTGIYNFRIDELVSAAELVQQQGEAAIATAESTAAALRQAGEIVEREAASYNEQFEQAARELEDVERGVARRALAIAGAELEYRNALQYEQQTEARNRLRALRAEQAAEQARAEVLREQIDALEVDIRQIDGRAEGLFAGARRLIASVRGEIEKAKQKREKEEEEERKRRDRLARERAEKRKGELDRLLGLERVNANQRAQLERQAAEQEAARLQARLANEQAALKVELDNRRQLAEGERKFAEARLLSADELESRLVRIGASTDRIARTEAEGLRRQIETLALIEAQARRVADARIAEANRAAELSVKAEEDAAEELTRKQPRDRARIAKITEDRVADIREEARLKTEKAEDELAKKLSDLGRRRLEVEQAIADARERQSEAIRDQDDGLRETLRRLRELGDERGSDFLKELSRDALDVADGAAKEVGNTLAAVLVRALTDIPKVAEDAVKELAGESIGEGTGEYVKGLVEDLVENIDEALTALKEIDEKIFEATAQAAADFTDAVGSAFSGGADRFVSAVTTAAASINEAIVAPIRALLGDGIASELVGGLLEIPGQIAGAIQSRFLSPFLSAVEGPLNELTRGFGEAASTLLSIEENRDDDRRRINEEFDARLAALQEGGASPDRIAALQQERERELSGVSDEQRSPAEIIDETFERALRILDVISAELPTLISNVVDRLIAELPRILSGVVQAITGVLNVLVGRLGPLISSVIEAIVAELPALIEAALALLPDILTGIFDGIVSIVDALPSIIQSVLSAIVDAIPVVVERVLPLIPKLLIGVFSAVVDLIPILIIALVDAVPAIVDGLVAALPGFIDALIDAVPILLSAAIRNLPALVAAILSIAPKVVESLFRLFVAYWSKLGEMIVSAAVTFWSWITTAATWLRDVFYSVGRFFQRIINGIGDGISDFGEWVASGFGIFHDGGVVGGRESSMGVFHDGGIVGSSRSAMRGLARDESINILQDGEVVLSREAVAGLGGATNANQLNGGTFQLGDPVINIVAGPGNEAMRTLLSAIIGAVEVNLRTPGGTKLSTAVRAANGSIQGVR